MEDLACGGPLDEVRPVAGDGHPLEGISLLFHANHPQFQVVLDIESPFHILITDKRKSEQIRTARQSFYAE